MFENFRTDFGDAAEIKRCGELDDLTMPVKTFGDFIVRNVQIYRLGLEGQQRESLPMLAKQRVVLFVITMHATLSNFVHCAYCVVIGSISHTGVHTAWIRNPHSL